MDNFNVFDKGGPVMFILAGLSIYVVAVVMFKIYQFYNSRSLETAFIEPVMADVAAQRFDKALATLQNIPGAVAAVMRTSLVMLMKREYTQEARQAEVQRVGSAEIGFLESHLRGLDLTANIGPLLGLLGTVAGMVTAFSKLQQQGTRVDPSQLAGGIWEALLTTVGGLLVAIPALAAFYIFDGIVERIRSRMRDVSVRILSMHEVLVTEKAEAERRKVEEAQQAKLAAEQRQKDERERKRREQEEQQQQQQAKPASPIKLVAPKSKQPA